MLNSFEEIAYWYLRLNGFFLLDNFVIHKSENIDYTSYADLLCTRSPFVFEDIGGKPEDWDDNLLSNFDNDALVGVVCQVKGGAIGDKDLFRQPYLDYSIQRLGLTEISEEISGQLTAFPQITSHNGIGHKFQIAKLLITRDEPKKDINYLWFHLDYVYDFIQQKINKYPKEKYSDRNFFSSIGLQTIIEMNELAKRKGK